MLITSTLPLSIEVLNLVPLTWSLADSVYAIIVPIVIIVVVLKISLICCRIWLYQKVCLNVQ